MGKPKTEVYHEKKRHNNYHSFSPTRGKTHISQPVVWNLDWQPQTHAHLSNIHPVIHLNAMCFLTMNRKNSCTHYASLVLDKLNQLLQLSSEPVCELENYCDCDPEFSCHVFCGKNGIPQWRSTVVSRIDTVIRSINRNEIRLAHEENREPDLMQSVLPHSFRHTFATRCLEAGIPPKIVQGWLGHASIKMTLDLYTHVSPDLSAGYMHVLESSLKKYN